MKIIFKQQFLTQKEVAQFFRVSTNTIGNWTKRGLLSVWQAPGSTRVLYLSEEVKALYYKNLKFRKEGDKRKQRNRVNKGKLVVSTKPDEDWRI